MIDSALGLNPEDMSEQAKSKRILRGLADLSGITFIAKIKVEPSSDARYGPSNRLDRVVLPTEPEWRKVMDGEVVPAQPSNRPRSTQTPATAAAAAAPAWAQNGGDANQPATPTWNAPASPLAQAPAAPKP